ncbi:hypothetical protein WL05_00230 [Burkholderia ubonensis]|nr:hypothetical protein WJ52_25575 [Burkholderia ubonensis]KVM18165.1 hypothetical protein WJ51_07690 [Burkholderia ubonensis]KVM54438.1 hypothetical protein WJ56_06420 [Burkholderia ubonensis]KVX54691.1 hypothetical protein WL05_00230 [Burkholderia ubonensis]
MRNAVAVTVATEPDYVKDCGDEGSKVTGKSLLARMKRHIEAAMTCALLNVPENIVPGQQPSVS